MSFNTSEELIIWDLESPPPTGKKVLLWNGYSDNQNHYSILKYIDSNSDRLRLEYLSIIYDLGELNVQGEKIVKHLEIMDNFSLWWMSLLAEKSTIKSNTIPTALRIMAIRDFIKELNPSHIEFYSANRTVSKSLIDLCELKKITYLFHYHSTKISKIKLLSVFESLPYTLQGLLFILNHIFKRLRLRNIPKPKWFSNHSSVFIFSYFFNLDKKKCSNGEFYSRQWEIFPKYLIKNGKKLNWLHHYLSAPNQPGPSTANRWIKSFNNNNEPSVHYFLDSFLSLKVIVQTLNKWFSLMIKTKTLEKEIYNCLKIVDQNWLWHIMLNDWKNSTKGASAMQNILWVYLLDIAMAKIPKQKLGFYLFENMDWEHAFIHFWRKHGHGKIIAIQHATIRYWDMRYFEDERVWHTKRFLSKPTPDKLAINGPLSYNAYIRGNQPISKTVKVEALRYLNLKKEYKFGKRNVHDIKLENNEINLLLLGDLVDDTTISMLELLTTSSSINNDQFKIIFKPHPFSSIDTENYTNLKLTLSNSDLKKLFDLNQIVISSTYTSAAVEAASLGIPVITVLNNKELNYSPLYGCEGFHFVSSKEELDNAITRICKNNKNELPENSYFWTNPDLPRWKKLLEFD